jgi:hypothetical protein
MFVRVSVCAFDEGTESGVEVRTKATDGGEDRKKIGWVLHVDD